MLTDVSGVFLYVLNLLSRIIPDALSENETIFHEDAP